MAIIYMHFMEQSILHKLPGILLWVRYIDDYFVVWREGIDSNIILNCANEINPFIQFTIELPNTLGHLPFLDFQIFREHEEFQYTLYNKPIHSLAITPWTSNCPFSEKRQVLWNEIDRAHKRSSNSTNVATSINKIKQRFKMNGYPNSFIMKTISQFKRGWTNNTDNAGNNIFLRFPFSTEQMKRRVKSLIRRVGLQDSVQPWFDSGKSLKQIFHPPKQRVVCEQQCRFCISATQRGRCFFKGVIYQIDCLYCGEIYIGETGRQIATRLKEHLNANSVSSAVSLHFRTKHPALNPSISWKLLETGINDYYSRRIIEAKCINQSTLPLMNGCQGHILHFWFLYSCCCFFLCFHKILIYIILFYYHLP